jgi:hypothetical protein
MSHLDHKMRQSAQHDLPQHSVTLSCCGPYWSHDEHLAALLQRQIADRESKGTVMRSAPHFPGLLRAS